MDNKRLDDILVSLNQAAEMCTMDSFELLLEVYRRFEIKEIHLRDIVEDYRVLNQAPSFSPLSVVASVPALAIVFELILDEVVQEAWPSELQM